MIQFYNSKAWENFVSPAHGTKETKQCMIKLGHTICQTTTSLENRNPGILRKKIICSIRNNFRCSIRGGIISPMPMHPNTPVVCQHTYVRCLKLNPSCYPLHDLNKQSHKLKANNNNPEKNIKEPVPS